MNVAVTHGGSPRASSIHPLFPALLENCIGQVDSGMAEKVKLCTGQEHPALAATRKMNRIAVQSALICVICGLHPLVDQYSFAGKSPDPALIIAEGESGAARQAILQVCPTTHGDTRRHTATHAHELQPARRGNRARYGVQFDSRCPHKVGKVVVQLQRLMYTRNDLAPATEQGSPSFAAGATNTAISSIIPVSDAMQSDTEIQALPLDTLAECCSSHTQRYLQRSVEVDTRYCFEIFRRAVIDGDQRAYALLCDQYRSMVTKWVRARLRYTSTAQDLDECVNWAFASMFRSLARPGMFANFVSLERLLGYLKSCAISAAETENRKVKQIVEELPEDLTDESGNPEVFVLQAENVETIRRLVLPLIKDRREQIVYESYFTLDMPPRLIYDTYPTLFSDVREVHRVKQIMLERIARNLRKVSKDLV